MVDDKQRRLIVDTNPCGHYSNRCYRVDHAKHPACQKPTRESGPFPTLPAATCRRLRNEVIVRARSSCRYDHFVKYR